MNQNGYGGAHLMLSFLAGAAAGACAALLTAPRTGADTREALVGYARDAQGQAVRVPEAVRDAYRAATVAAKEAFAESIRRSSEHELASSND